MASLDRSDERARDGATDGSDPAVEHVAAAVIGGGPAGLATSRELRRRRVPHVVLERGEVGESWARYYDSLTLHTGRHMSTLPGMRFPRGTPLFVARATFVEYLRRYAERFALPVRTQWPVDGLEPVQGEGREPLWRVVGARGEIRARAAVVATGIAANPRRPTLDGAGEFRGRILHSAEYRNPDGFIGQRVLVVGAGNSGGEIASELALAGATVAIAVRSGANVVPRAIAGIPTQYVARVVRMLPRPVQERIVAVMGRITERRQGPPVLPRAAQGALDAIPIIGFHLTDAIRAGRVAVRPGVERLTSVGARFTDGREGAFDAVILATGFAPALGPLDGLVRTDARGFALRTDRVTSADVPRLWFVGQNYDATGGLANIARDARLAARAVRDALA